MLQSVIHTHTNNFGHKVELQLTPDRGKSGVTLINFRLCEPSPEGILALLKEKERFIAENDGFCGHTVDRQTVAEDTRFLEKTKGRGVLWLSHHALGLQVENAA